MGGLQRWVDDYEVLVINDTRVIPHFSNMWRRGVTGEIRVAARAAGVRHRRFPQYLHTRRELIFPEEPKAFRELEDANSRCADAIQYGVNLLLSESDQPILILDADMIPVAPFYWKNWLKRYPIWGVPENKGPGIDYLWNGIILVDPAQVNAMDRFNIDCGQLDGVPVDVGGMLHEFLRANEGRVGTISRLYDWIDGFELCGDIFAHLRGGGNWQVFDQDEAQERVNRFIRVTRDYDRSSS
jgi:hypothetical protein